MQRLIVRLGSHIQDPIHWLVYSNSESEILASGKLNNASELSQLQEHALGTQIVGLVPASDVYCTHVSVPKKGGRKVLTAIPFMVEEDLAANIDELFFALGNNKNDVQEVAVITKQKMQLWQSMFADANLFCATLIPDAYCLPNDEHINLLQIDQQLLARLPNGTCMQGEDEWLLPLMLEQANTNNTALKCHSEIAQWPEDQEATFDFDKLPLQLLLEHSTLAQLNLCQGEFATKRKTNTRLHKWKLAASLAAVAICANLIYTTVELNALKNQHAELTKQTKALVQQGFPNLRSVRLVRPAVEREMAKLAQGGTNISMLAMLSQLGGAFEASGVKPQNIRYDNTRSELRMQSVASNFESLDKFKRDVQNLGFEVEQGAINNRGSEVVGVIVVKG